MPRAKKVKATEPAPLDNSGDEQAPGAPVTGSSEALEGVRGKPGIAKGSKRGKAVSINVPEDKEDADIAPEEAPITKPLSRAAQKKKDLEAASDSASGVTEEVKKGRGRGKKNIPDTQKDADEIPDFVESTVSLKKGKGRPKKETISATGVLEADEPESSTTKSGKESKSQTAAKEEVPEKKKKGGRPKKTIANEENVEQPDLKSEQPAEKVAESKATSQENQQEEQGEAVPDNENASTVEQDVVAPEPKKKGGRGRKAVVAATTEPEMDEAVDSNDLAIYQAPTSNIEMRKGRGASKPTTPSVPKSPKAESVAEEKKSRGRAKKTPVVTPQRDSKDVLKKSARAVKMTTSQKENAEEEPVAEKKRIGRPKKNVEKPQSEVDEGSPATPLNERKRKEGGTQSQIVKKSLKQK